MSFVPFFLRAFSQAFDAEKYADTVLLGEKLAAEIRRGIWKGGGETEYELFRLALATAYLDTAIEKPAEALKHLARYLAASGEYWGAGKLLDAYEQDVSRRGRARALKQARIEAMSTTKRLRQARWIAVVEKVGQRIREKEAWPREDIKLTALIMSSQEYKSLGDAAPAVSTVRGQLRKLKLDAKTWREPIRAANRARQQSVSSRKRRQNTLPNRDLLRTADRTRRSIKRPSTS